MACTLGVYGRRSHLSKREQSVIHIGHTAATSNIHLHTPCTLTRSLSRSAPLYWIEHLPWRVSKVAPEEAMHLFVIQNGLGDAESGSAHCSL